MYDKLSTSLLAEFIGTFALIFIGAGAGALAAADGGGLVGVAFAHGLVIVAAFTLSWVLGARAGSLGATVLADGVSPAQGLVLELIMTFFLVNTIMNAGISSK